MLLELTAAEEAADLLAQARGLPAETLVLAGQGVDARMQAAGKLDIETAMIAASTETQAAGKRRGYIYA